MKSGTEKNPNPHEVSLAKFLGARAAHVTTGYLGLRTGQIVRQDTGGVRNRHDNRPVKHIPEPKFRDSVSRLSGSKKRKLKAYGSINPIDNSYRSAVNELRQSAKVGYMDKLDALGWDRDTMPVRLMAAWASIRGQQP